MLNTPSLSLQKLPSDPEATFHAGCALSSEKRTPIAHKQNWRVKPSLRAEEPPRVVMAAAVDLFFGRFIVYTLSLGNQEGG